MPKTAADFLKELAIKAGVNIDDDTIKPLLAAPELAGINIPDQLITGIDNGLLSISAAKNNHPEIKGHYVAAAYDGLDKEINRFMDDYKLPDDIKAEILAERSSTKRAVLLSAKIKALEEQKANSGKGEKDTLQLQINDLNAQLRAEKDKEAGIRAEYEGKLKDVKMGHTLGALLGGYKTIYDELDGEVKDITLKAIINKSLNADAAEFTVDESGQLVLRKKDGTNFFGEDNRLLTPKSYLDKIMSRDKIIKVTDQNQNQNNGNGNGAKNHLNNNGNQQRQNQNQNGNGNGNGNAVNHTLNSLADQALAALEKTNGVM
jgi:hypothetical protein